MSLILYLSQNAVHDPIDTGGADAVGSADAALLQVLHNALDEGQLDVLGVLDAELLAPLLGAEQDGFVGEDGEAELSAVADELDAIGAGTLVTDEAPGAAAGESVGELESGAHGVLRLVESAAVAAEPACPDDGAEYLLEQVYLVRGEVVEIAAASNVPLYAPRQGGAVVV